MRILARMRTVGILAALLLAAGCQDNTTGIQTLCNAPRDCAECQTVDPALHDQTMAKHIQRTVRNDDARALLEKMEKVDDGKRAKLLKDAADAAGLSSCILADQYKARHEAWEAHQKGEGAKLPTPEGKP